MHGLHAAEVAECLYALLPDIYSHSAGNRGCTTAISSSGTSGTSGGSGGSLYSDGGRGSRAITDTVQVAVITGSGHHTTGNKGADNLSRTYHAAVGVCDGMGLSYRVIKDPKGHVGGIIIRLTEKCVDRYE